GAIVGPVAYFWQVELDPGTGLFTDLQPEEGDIEGRTIGQTLLVTPNLEGLSIRVKAHFQDANGTFETVYSAPTLLVGPAIPGNQETVGTVALSAVGRPSIGEVLDATPAFSDGDGIQAGSLAFQWQRGNSAGFVDIAGAVGPSYEVAPEDGTFLLRAVVSYVDGDGNTEQVVSEPTLPVREEILGTEGPDILTGTPQPDIIRGFGGNDFLFGLESA